MRRARSLLLFIVPATFLLLSTPGRADWERQWPLPQGQALRDVVLLDANTAVAVGRLGTVVHTSDGGASWSVTTRVNGISSTLHTVEAVGTVLFALGYDGTFLRSDDGGATWVAQASPSSNQLTDIAFYDADTGFLAADTELYRTDDGGATWTQKPLPAGLSVAAVDMGSPLFVLVVGSASAFSYDGGDHWTDVTAQVPGGRDVEFLSAGTAVVGDGADIYLTTDAGVSFSLIGGAVVYPYTSADINAVAISSSDNIRYAANQFSSQRITHGQVGGTGDQGATWSSISFECVAWGIDVLGDGTGCAVGDNGQIRWSTDGGATWTLVAGSPYFVGQPHHAFRDLNNGVVFDEVGAENCEQRTRLRWTSDGGISWTYTSMDGGMGDIAYLDASTLYASGWFQCFYGFHGVVRMSTDGGATWTTILDIFNDAVTPPLFYNVRGVDVCDSGHGIAVGYVFIGADQGEVFTIDGASVTHQASPTPDRLADVAMFDCDHAVAVGNNGAIVYTADGGVNWMAASSGAASNLEAVVCAGGTRAFAVGRDGVVLMSDDLGATWVPRTTGTADHMADVSFVGPDDGVVVGGSTIFRTANAGQSWTQDALPNGLPLAACSYFGTGNVTVTSGYEPETFAVRSPVVVAVSEFRADAGAREVTLSWRIVADGTVRELHILRDGERVAVLPAEPAGRWTDRDVTPGSRYVYNLELVGEDGGLVRSPDARADVPVAPFTLEQNVPNPFNPETTIRFSVPERARAVVRVFDARGALIATLVDRVVEAGPHETRWAGTAGDGTRVASGVYFCRLEVNGRTQSRKMLVLK